MRSLLLNLTTSLDGYIADAQGGVDWILPPPASVPQDYLDLIDTVDALVMGRLTYETSLKLDGGMGVFEGKDAYVFTSHDLSPRQGVEFVREDPVTFVARLKERPGGTIWLFGGGQLASALSSAGLVDEYLIALQPILLGDGIPLWRGGGERRLELLRAREWPDGIVELRYRRKAD